MERVLLFMAWSGIQLGMEAGSRSQAIRHFESTWHGRHVEEPSGELELPENE